MGTDTQTTVYKKLKLSILFLNCHLSIPLVEMNYHCMTQYYQSYNDIHRNKANHLDYKTMSPEREMRTANIIFKTLRISNESLQWNAIK